MLSLAPPPGVRECRDPSVCLSVCLSWPRRASCATGAAQATRAVPTADPSAHGRRSAAAIGGGGGGGLSSRRGVTVLLGRIAGVMRCDVLLTTFRGRRVCVSVGRSLSCANTAGPIELRFGMWTRVEDTGNRVFDGGSELPGRGEGQFLGTCPALPPIEILLIFSLQMSRASLDERFFHA